MSLGRQISVLLLLNTTARRKGFQITHTMGTLLNASAKGTIKMKNSDGDNAEGGKRRGVGKCSSEASLQ